MDLDSLKYADLQSLAKKLGLKANMKAAKLMKAIKQHQQEKENNQESKTDCIFEIEEKKVQEDDKENQDASISHLFVNTRRGRGKTTKREAEVEGDAKMTQEGEMSGPDTTFDATSAKRKVCFFEKPEEETCEEAMTCNEDQIDSKDEAPVTAAEKATKIPKAGKIPRYQGSQRKSKTLLKPITPNFKKLHEAQFNKMESIDSYVERKKSYKKPVKEAKLPDKAKQQQPDTKAQMKKNLARATMFSPAQGNGKTAPGKRRHTEAPSAKAQKEVTVLSPFTRSTRKNNVQFAKTAVDNESKGSLVKTPARMSMCLASSTPQKPTAQAHKPQNKNVSTKNNSGVFVFTGNTSNLTTPGTQKPTFDLKASLSRPLTYKPHKGKLKPFGEAKDMPSANKSLVTNPRQESYKQPKLQSRNDRRTKQIEGRKQKKDCLLGARRGLVMN